MGFFAQRRGLLVWPELTDFPADMELLGRICLVSFEIQGTPIQLVSKIMHIFRRKKSGFMLKITDYVYLAPKRKYYRVPIQASGFCWLLDNELGIASKNIPVRAVNISSGGVLVKSQRALEPGALVKLKLFIQQKQAPIFCTSHVLRVNKDEWFYFCALQWQKISAIGNKRILSVCHSQEVSQDNDVLSQLMTRKVNRYEKSIPW